MGGDGSQGRIPGEITWKLRPGEEATFLSRKAACVFECHRGDSGMVGKIAQRHATGQWKRWWWNGSSKKYRLG